MQKSKPQKLHSRLLASNRKEERMDKKIVETINALCDWIQAELKNASSVQTESILPAVIEATAKLIDTNRV